jgi:hypothetical protein
LLKIIHIGVQIDEGNKEEQMNTWEAIFSQSPVNNGYYNGEKLPQAHWDWPKRTWFQARLNQVREHDRPWQIKSAREQLTTARPLRTM